MKDITAYLLLLLIFCGCQAVEEASDMPDSGEPIRISFRLVTSTPTRDDLSGYASENYINVKDITYLLFDKDANFLTDMTPHATTVAANSSFTICDVVAEITSPYFRENVNHDVEFIILALVNHSGWNATIPQMQTGENIDSLFADGIKMTVLPETSKLRLTPQATSQQYFPMAGIQTFKVAGNMFQTTWDGLPFDITRATGKSVCLLRALSKIEVIDKINMAEDNIYNSTVDPDGIRIADVTLNGYMADGLLLPTRANWDRNNSLATDQVSSPTVTGSSAYVVATTSTNESTLLPFIKDEEASAERDDKAPVFSTYIYEFSPEAVAEAPSPSIVIGFDERLNSDTGSTEIEGSSFSFSLASTSPLLPSGGAPSLLRNHIYRYEISGVQSQPRITLEVSAMDKVSTDITFN